MDDTRPSLLVRLRDPRDRAAWGTFVDVYGPVVYGSCRRHGLGHQDAEDVTQRVFVRAVNGLREFRYQPDKGRFRDWFGTVVRNEVYRFRDESRRHARAASESAFDGVAAPNADDSWDAAIQERLLRVALERAEPAFEPPTWKAFIATWLHNRPAAEVATELGLPIDAVYVAKSRALKRLTAEVAALSDDLP